MASKTAVIAWSTPPLSLSRSDNICFYSDFELLLVLRGSGEDGQLGIGNIEEKEWVCSIDALSSEKVCSVVAGSRNSLAICEDGKVFLNPFTLYSTVLILNSSGVQASSFSSFLVLGSVLMMFLIGFE